jgi:hypothetical protein
MQGNPRIVELIAVHEVTNNLELSVVLEIRESDVRSVIRAGIHMDIHKLSVVSQMLIGVRYAHSRKLIDRDLKVLNL